ncbi:hypothetical protein BU16DRAFT_52284 [Lophium mytilinum]|uniref:Uncharacterized protein n=1 Tax=Lophium mytilinum TaxID=390894 RepID=A0A6A6QMT6_9PEZI|nr:hypothetical protein BU16DRAFT_52284 [Lophium mytilinum]
MAYTSCQDSILLMREYFNVIFLLRVPFLVCLTVLDERWGSRLMTLTLRYLFREEFNGASGRPSFERIISRTTQKLV